MPTPKIHRIRIEKFRRFQEPLELTLETPRGKSVPLAVLAGPNGCGKTTVLEAILLALGREDLLREDRREVPEGAKLEIGLSVDGEPVTFTRTKNNHVQEPPSPTGVDVTRERIDSIAVAFYSSWRSPELVGAIKPLVGRGARPADTENNRLYRLKQRINDERARAGYGAVPADSKRADQWLDRLNRAWALFHNDDGTTIDAQIVDPESEELLADLYVLTKEGKRICSVDHASSGEIELLMFAGWLILQDFKDGLVLIDEPELHLHPEWQATILPAMQQLAPDSQFIVATHADDVWDQAPSYARFLLVSDDDPRSLAWRKAHEASGSESTDADK